ncbi:MAG: hypothetical protein HC772_12145 [Leptolyngbyaceae cyanobacterium CRU_2_3]|nr:hypothetical protein [Leptolyngbyaceae cyanobacterium CRU_2_3]
MPTPSYLLEFAIAELFVQTSMSGRITLADRYGLQAALLTGYLSDEERFAIDRLLYAVCKGRVKMVDELSTLAVA